MPSGMTAGKPTRSHATSAPTPPVHWRTSFTRSRRSASPSRSIVWSAPKARASSRRPGIWSTTMTRRRRPCPWPPRPPACRARPRPGSPRESPDRGGHPVQAVEHLGRARSSPGATASSDSSVRHLEDGAAAAAGSSGRRRRRAGAGTRPARAAARSCWGRPRAPCAGTRGSARTDRSRCRPRDRLRWSGRRSESVFTLAPSRRHASRSSRGRRSSRRPDS